MFDYFPFIDKRVSAVRGLIPGQEHNEHAEILRRGIDNRMDIYKLGFVVSQIFALVFLTFSVLRKNSQLETRYKAGLKLRLI